MTRLPEEVHSNKAFEWAAKDSSGVLSPFNFFTSETGEKDVTFKLHYYGICHSDLHMVKNEWGNSIYPLIVGEVTEIGCKVQKFKVRDRVGVGCMVGSCHSCDNCINNLENKYPKMIFTYGTKYYDGAITHGGYSNTMIVDEHFVISIPENLPLDATAPLLCARITVYSYLRFYGLDKPAVKFAKAMGTNVTMINTSPSKQNEALENLGADLFLVSRDQDQLQVCCHWHIGWNHRYSICPTSIVAIAWPVEIS
ncbi:hypothetical protein ERO13_A02G145701v2 [Gossypium hirsutum]|nr:hypothetical protein ERO13_A02G145701v2 [Gossypium hirsutum]